MKHAVARELKASRIRNGMSQKDVAKRLKISVMTLARYEKTGNGLSIEKLEKILDLYGVDTLIFFRNVCDEKVKGKNYE